MTDIKITAAMREDWIKALHEGLADATILVWKMQNALTEQREAALPEIEQYASQLRERAGVILGAVSRWSMLEGDKDAKDN